MFELEAYAQETQVTQETTQVPAGEVDGIQPVNNNPAGGMYEFFMMMGLIFVIFYFLLIRPEKRKREEQEKKINSLKKGDMIITAGGIYGSIVGVKDDVAVIKIAENVKIEILKSAISTIVADHQKK